MDAPGSKESEAATVGDGILTQHSPHLVEPTQDSEVPTDRAPEKSADAAKIAAQALDQEPPHWDSEAPTGVVTDRPLLPRPPRAPTL